VELRSLRFIKVLHEKNAFELDFKARPNNNDKNSARPFISYLLTIAQKTRSQYVIVIRALTALLFVR